MEKTSIMSAKEYSIFKTMFNQELDNKVKALLERQRIAINDAIERTKREWLQYPLMHRGEEFNVTVDLGEGLEDDVIKELQANGWHAELEEADDVKHTYRITRTPSEN